MSDPLHQSTPASQVNVSPRRQGDAWVVYPDGSHTGLMPWAEAREYSRIFDGVLFRLPPRTWVGKLLRRIGL